MSNAKWMALSITGILALLAWGCAGKATSAVPQDPGTGKHPANWAQVHYIEYTKAPDTCRTCHGSTVDPAQSGGISKVSCFTCHPTGVNHPADWALRTQHGVLGAQAATSSDPKAMTGMAHCKRCHGEDYASGPAGSCKACHTKAPHPSRPWTSKTTGTASHVNTDYSNAAACAQCHTAGANSVMKPLVTPPAGTQPGCFNETLCHGTNIARP